MSSLFSAKKSFFRSSNRGGKVTVQKQVRAMYLRSDVPCGCWPLLGSGCCDGAVEQEREKGTGLDPQAECYLIPDTNVFLHNIDALESPLIKNVIVLDTVLQETKGLNRGVYARIETLVKDRRRRFHVFANENHKETHQPEQEAGESANDRNDKAIRVAAKWYQVHLSTVTDAPRVVLVTHDRANRAAAEAMGIECTGMADHVARYFSHDKELMDKVSSGESAENERRTAGQRIYQPWKSQDDLDAGVASGRYKKGTLRQQGTNIHEGWASCPLIDEPKKFMEVLLPNKPSINRCIDSDTVAVEVLPPAQWTKPSRLIRQEGRSDPSVATGVMSGVESEEEAKAKGFVPTGKVVGLLANKRRPICGTIIWDPNESSSGFESVLFQPVKGNFPRIRLQTRQVDHLKNKRILAVIDDWPVTSGYPNGHYVRVLGDVGDKNVEAEVILLENDVPHYAFSKGVIDCLPKGIWRIEPEEEEKRADFRDRDICSIDPPGCRDIDDALHCMELPNGNYEIGVHIADVTHFMKEGSALDIEASKRSTSVYLVDRRIDMLPKLLTENLCSLVGGEDRYTFSVWWEFTPDAQQVSVEFGKAIIRSKQAMTYYRAQDICDDPHDTTPLARSIKQLMRLSRILKQRRIDAGALTLAGQEMRFEIDRDNINSNPTDVQEYLHIPTMSMVEEWMLAANCAVATKCYETFPKWACLRRHPSPADSAFDGLNEALKAQNMPELDASSSKALADSLDICNDGSDPYFNKLVRILTTRNMQQAKYFSTGDYSKDDFWHYGLAMPMYTHFTSPIRRYADDVIHRQLAAALGIAARSDKHMDADYMKEMTENLNYRHTCAQNSSRDSRNLYTGFFFDGFRDGRKIDDQDAYVVRTLDNGVVVMVMRWGMEGTVYFDDAPQWKGKLRLLDKLRVSVVLKEGAQGDAARNKLQYSIVQKIDVRRRVSPIIDETLAPAAAAAAAEAAKKPAAPSGGPTTTLKVDNVVFGGGGQKRKRTVTKVTKIVRRRVDTAAAAAPAAAAPAGDGAGGLKGWDDTPAPAPPVSPAAQKPAPKSGGGRGKRRPEQPGPCAVPRHPVAAAPKPAAPKPAAPKPAPAPVPAPAAPADAEDDDEMDEDSVEL